jgi:hypothetical protein
MKKYIANTHVSINVVLASGANRHVAFDSTSNGSVLYVDDEDIQKALESHSKFGKLFRIDTTFVQNKTHTKSAAEAKAAEEVDGEPTEATEETSEVDETESEGEGEEVADGGLKTIYVTDADDAKTYLAEHFGVSRTKMKSLVKIKAEAAANGIVFEGI